MKTFKISVVIPVYKAYDYLAKCLDSVINQSLSFEDNVELILINDGLWKALSLALIIIAIIGLGSKQIKRYNQEILKQNKQKQLLLEDKEK